MSPLAKKACVNPDCPNKAEQTSRTGLCRACWKAAAHKGTEFNRNGRLRAPEIKLMLDGAFNKFSELNGTPEDFWAVPRFSGNWIVISDIHIPLHDPMYLTRVMQAGVTFSVSNLIIVGDLIDWSEISRFPKYRPNLDPVSPLRDAIEILLELSKVFKRIVVLKGNHERRLQRLLEQAVEGRTTAQRHLAALDLHDFTSDSFRDQYISVMESWTKHVASGRVAKIEWYAGAVAEIEGPPNLEPWRLIHQGNGSILPPNEAKKHWEKHQQPIITTHTHLFGLRIMPNGIDPAVQLGMGTREEWHQYANEEPGGYPAWVRNFAVIIGGKLANFTESPYLLNPLELLEPSYVPSQAG